MNPGLVVQILQLALSLVEAQLTGKAQSDATLAQTLVNIVQASAQAYQDHTGQPIDSCTPGGVPDFRFGNPGLRFFSRHRT